MLALFDDQGWKNALWWHLKKKGKIWKRKGRGVLVRWFDNKAVHLVSSYAGVEPVGKVRRYDPSLRQHANVPQPYIVQV